MSDEAGGPPTSAAPSTAGGGGMIMQSCPKFPDHSACLIEQLNVQRFYGAFCDVTVRVEDCDFRLHKCVLAATSSKLQSMMYGISGELSSILSLKDVSVNGFRIVMDYIYSGVLRLDSVCAHDVLSTAHFLELHEIHRACLDFLRQVHMDIQQPRCSTAFDPASALGLFRSNSQMLNIQGYAGLPMDLPPSQPQNFPMDLPNQQQGIPHDQQSIPPEADDICSEQGNPQQGIPSEGIPQNLHQSHSRLASSNNLHSKQLPSLSNQKLMQSETTMNQNQDVLHDEARLLGDQTFNLSPAFNPQHPPPPPPPPNQLLSHQSLEGYQPNEQLLPLNLHRVPNNQLVLSNNPKNMDLHHQGVLSHHHQPMSAESHLLSGNEGFDADGPLILPNDQYSSASLLGNHQSLSGGNPENGGQLLNGGSSGLGEGMGMKGNGLMPMGVVGSHQGNPLTPGATSDQPPNTPTPTPPLQQQVFPMPNPNLVIEDYLKLIESYPGEQGNVQIPNDLTMDTGGIGGHGSGSGGGSNNGYSYKQDYGKNGGIVGNIMDMGDHLLPQHGGLSIQQSYSLSNGNNNNMVQGRQHDDSMQSNNQITNNQNSLSRHNSIQVSTSGPSFSSNLSTVEDVRKTILSVLSQERFDEDEDSLARSLETGSRSAKDSVPLTSLLNIATVSQRQCQDLNIDSSGLHMGKMLFKVTENENMAMDDENFDDHEQHHDTDSDHEGNLVIVEPELEEQAVYEACNIANSSDVNMEFDNSYGQDTSLSKSPEKDLKNGERTKLTTFISEYEDDYRNCSNTDVQLDNNFAKPLKKRLRLKLKKADENDESEVNTPVETETPLPDLTAIVESEPVSRKKHLLDSSKNIVDFCNNSSSSNSGIGNGVANTVISTPTTEVYPMTMFENQLNVSPGNNESVVKSLYDIEEDVYQIQSKKQKASKHKEKQQQEKDLLMEKERAQPKMKHPHRKLKCAKDEDIGSEIVEHVIAKSSPDKNEAVEVLVEMEKGVENSNQIQTQDAVVEVQEDVVKLKPKIKPTLKKVVKKSKFKSSENVVKKPLVAQSQKQIRKDDIVALEPLPVLKKSGVDFHCDLCGRDFPKAQRLKYHLEQHSLNQLHPCDICGQKFGRAGELTRHLRQHVVKMYKCRTCSAEFQNSNLYRAHCTKVHDEQRMFYCSHPGCDFDSAKLSRIEEHEKVHSAEKAYNCENCGQSFRQPNGLRSHQQSCKNRQSHSCQYCDKKFNYVQGLRQHELTHSTSRPLECPKCGIRVRDPRNLRRHMRTHDQSFPYACPKCPKKYRFSNSLKQHLQNHCGDLIANGSAKKLKKKSRKKSVCEDAVVTVLAAGKQVLPPSENEESSSSEKTRRLWDATAVKIKSSNRDNTGPTMKVKLEATLVTDSGYV